MMTRTQSSASTETNVPWHEIFFTAYWWLVDQNLWKACVNWTVAGILTIVFIRRPWKKHMKAQKAARVLTHTNQTKIMDQLDTDTPGGLSEVVSSIRKLSDEISALREDKP